MNEKYEMIFENIIDDLLESVQENETERFTNFLGSREIDIIKRKNIEVKGVSTVFYGGYHDSERVILGLFPYPMDDVEDEKSLSSFFPIQCLYLKNKNIRFQKTVTHRDYLGAMMNLGIARDRIGDIVVDETGAYVFCVDKVCDYILQNISFVGRNAVSVSKVVVNDIEISKTYRKIQATVSSVRMDTIVANAIFKSRNQVSDLFKTGKVISGHKCIQSLSYIPKSEEIFVIKGYGKFKLEIVKDYLSKKGKIRINIYKFC